MNDRTARINRQAERLRREIRSQRMMTGVDTTSGEVGRVRLEEAARLASVTAHWGIATDIPVVTRAVVMSRRAMRLLLRWYINPIVEQQNAYNQSVLNALRDLRAENDALQVELNRVLGMLPTDEGQ